MEKEWKEKLRTLIDGGYYLQWEEYKNERHQIIENKITEAIEDYTRSRAAALPYEQRKKLGERIMILEELLYETEKSPKSPIEWMEPDDIRNIEEQGLKKFLDVHFERSINKTY